jgi:fructose-1-phosphate kinase PfkB-like protein
MLLGVHKSIKYVSCLQGEGISKIITSMESDGSDFNNNDSVPHTVLPPQSVEYNAVL